MIFQRCDSLEDANGVLIKIKAKSPSKVVGKEPENVYNSRHSSFNFSQSDKQALLNSVRSKVMRSSFSMDKEKPTNRKFASDIYRKIKKRMMYR